MERLYQPDYWYSLAESIWTWLAREIFTGHSLINIAVVMVGLLLAWLVARPLKPKLAMLITSRKLDETALGRFLAPFMRFRTMKKFETTVRIQKVQQMGF